MCVRVCACACVCVCVCVCVNCHSYSRALGYIVTGFKMNKKFPFLKIQMSNPLTKG